MVAYPVPQRAAQRILERRGLPVPEGDIAMAQGIAIPVVILLAVALVMTVIARRTRFGRYVFATGGNPEAAELSGIDTRLLTVKVFALMGALTAIAAVIASARLNAVGNDLGTLDELRTIAATVIGGTALAGGAGTIYGAVLGALVMQSLQSGMAMVGVDAPLQSIVVGVVLVFAVWVDILYRRRTGT
jgi:D-xylose transport system permease protein